MYNNGIKNDKVLIYRLATQVIDIFWSALKNYNITKLEKSVLGQHFFEVSDYKSKKNSNKIHIKGYLFNINFNITTISTHWKHWFIYLYFLFINYHWRTLKPFEIDSYKTMRNKERGHDSVKKIFKWDVFLICTSPLGIQASSKIS